MPFGFFGTSRVFDTFSTLPLQYTSTLFHYLSNIDHRRSDEEVYGFLE